MSHDATLHPLRHWRQTAKLSLEAAGDRVGVTRQAWKDWETGRRIPNRATMARVCTLTGLTANAFHDFPTAVPTRKVA